MTRSTTALRWGLGGLFIGASVLQGTHRDFFEALVPEQAAEHKDQIQGAMTGALAGLGLSFLIPRWGTTIALLATLPAAVDCPGVRSGVGVGSVWVTMLTVRGCVACPVPGVCPGTRCGRVGVASRGGRVAETVRYSGHDLGLWS